MLPVLLSVCLLPLSSAKYERDYTLHPPVKMIDIQFTNERFAASDHLTDHHNGQAENANRSPTEVLNDLPETWHTIYPGGYASFSLPVKFGEEFLTVYTGKLCHSTEGSRIVVRTSSGEKECETDSCSVTSCSLDVSEIIQESYLNQDVLHVDVSVPAESKGPSSVWELDLNFDANDVKVKGIFEKEGRELIKSTQDLYDKDTSLSMFTFLGAKGVGKSTIASLLSGKGSMFPVSDSGVDLSPVIPSEDYAARMRNKLDNDIITDPDYSLPLFIIDTEAMGVRGEAFEFISTSTPSIISKMIIWVDDNDGLNVDRILSDIDEYITNLNRVVTKNSYVGDNVCQDVTFGEFKIVVNKMTGDWNDDELEYNLLAEEAEMDHDAIQRDAIRRRIKNCFKKASALGLPLENQSISYNNLSKRFKNGLAQMVSEILHLSTISKYIRIGEEDLELNAEYGETLIGAIVEQANNGVIDLSGFQSYWAYKKQEVQQELDKAIEDLELSNCLRVNNQYMCSKCVCVYRNSIIDSTEETIKNRMYFIAGEAKGIFQKDINEEIGDLNMTLIHPWIEDNKCFNIVDQFDKNHTQCDMASVLQDADDSTFLPGCKTAFFCGHVLAPFTNLTLIATSIFLEEGAVLEFLAPDQARNGEDAEGFDASGNGLPGENGEDGGQGASVFIDASFLLPTSGTSLRVISSGGDGGNGGKGGNGRSGKDGKPGELRIHKEEEDVSPIEEMRFQPQSVHASFVYPRNAEEVCRLGDLVHEKHDMYVEGRCSACSILLYNHVYSYRFKQSVKVNGTTGLGGVNGDNGEDGLSGGNGGNGANGGSGGSVIVQNAGIKVLTEKIGGKGGEGGYSGFGGSGGVGGNGGEGEPGLDGFRQTKVWTARKRSSDNFSCDGCKNTLEQTNIIYDKYLASSQETETCCQGARGSKGSAGRNGEIGEDGSSGERGNDALEIKDSFK